ncbi:MAG: ATP-binding protein, partial [Gemmatimonadaceae bacterium]
SFLEEPLMVLEAVSSDRLSPTRLAALRRTALLDSAIDEAFDRLTRLAVRLLDIPAAFISLVDENRDFYKSACGFGEPLAAVRELTGPTFCHFAIRSVEPLVIPDTAGDPRYRDVPTVKSLGVAAYVGIPLVVDGEVIGAFCAVDVKPRDWTEREVESLRDLAAITLREIELGAANARNDLARAEAEAERRRMAELFRQAPAFIAVLRGDDHVFEMANDAYHQLVGHREILGKAVRDALPEIRDQGFLELLDSVLASGQPFVGRELPVILERTPGVGDPTFVTFVYHPITEVDGTHSGIFVHGFDVTDQVNARTAIEGLNQRLKEQAAELEVQTTELQATTDELRVSTGELSARTGVAEKTAAALAASEHRYRTLTEAVPVQVWTATADGALDFVSSQVSEYFGVPHEKALGDGWASFVHPDDRPSTAARWGESLQTGKPYEAEFRLIEGATGEYRWHLARALPVRAEDGAIIGWIGTNTDVEGERRARAQAEAANEAKSDFLAVMSHELRTPLNAIGGYAELLAEGLRGPVTELQVQDLDRIQRSQRHLLGLINGILNFAKLDAGMIDYAVEDVAVDAVIAGCESLTLPQAEKKGLTLRYDNRRGELLARADSEKVQQVLLNLLSNAIKFTPSGGTITVKGDQRDERIIVRVSDNGRGIPADQVERVFEPFVQIADGTSGVHGGTGLGLAISRDLARGMGGDLTVKSVVGEGSTFVLSLPSADVGMSEATLR